MCGTWHLSDKSKVDVDPDQCGTGSEVGDWFHDIPTVLAPRELGKEAKLHWHGWRKQQKKDFTSRTKYIPNIIYKTNAIVEIYRDHLSVWTLLCFKHSNLSCLSYSPGWWDTSVGESSEKSNPTSLPAKECSI